MNAEVKKILLEMMEENIDAVMFAHGFKRRANSVIYSRKIGAVKQRMEMVAFSHPSYHPGAIAHIYPWLTVHYPEIEETVVKLAPENLIDSWKDATIRQPIQIYFQSERWMLIDEAGAVNIAECISDFLNEYTIPLLDDLRCIEDFIKIYETQDKRIIMDDKNHLYIVCAYIIKGDYKKAQNVLEQRFGKLGLRNRYASAFNYLESIIGDMNI